MRLRGLIGGFVPFLLAFLWGCGGGGGGRQFLSIGTAGTGGIYYPIGGALASRLSVRDSLRQFTAEVTGGSVENVNRLREGQIDMGFALAATAYEAFHGGQDYGTPFQGLRVVAPLYANLVHVLVPRGSTATSLAEHYNSIQANDTPEEEPQPQDIVYFGEPLQEPPEQPAPSGQKRKQFAAGLIGLAAGLFLAFIGQFLKDD